MIIYYAYNKIAFFLSLLKERKSILIPCGVRARCLKEGESTKYNLGMHFIGFLLYPLQALRETDNRVSLIWKHQLMQFNNLSESMAAAVVASWPSPAHLLSVSVTSYQVFITD